MPLSSVTEGKTTYFWPDAIKDDWGDVGPGMGMGEGDSSGPYGAWPLAKPGATAAAEFIVWVGGMWGVYDGSVEASADWR